MTTGEKIKKLRVEKMMTQSQLVGDQITRNMLSRIESDEANPSLGTLLYIAKRLNVPAGYLLADENEDAIYAKSFALENRRLAYMPLPKANADKIGKNSMFDLLYSMSFINGTIPSNKIKCAKMFLQYANTDESLEDFTVITGTTKSLKYDMDDRYDELSFYGKSLWNYVENSEVIYPYSQNNLYLGNQSTFMMFWPRMWTCTINNNTVEGMCGKIADSGQLTAKQAFDGLKDYYTENYWKGAYSSYINAN